MLGIIIKGSKSAKYTGGREMEKKVIVRKNIITINSGRGDKLIRGDIMKAIE